MKVNVKPPGRFASLPMGEMAVAMNDGLLRTLLGSCLGLALYDYRTKVAGLAHIVLPDSQGRGELPGKYADTAIPALLERMRELADVSLSRLSAKVAGGANMFAASSGNTVGVQNLAAVERILGRIGIPIVGRHCGGECGRRMAVDSTSGAVTVEIAGQEPINI